ncbi:MAG: HAMP domain-containing sensor histidine kinase [Sulfurimonas sp.]|nr:HAMP domain-containing sensor histidine kinase [Sulfurimonas sp.]MDD5203647.1 HAMP domain-containing sensor histidine kinase [Sulfurimonas sp.]
MYSGEKKTIFYVLVLYLSSTVLLITTLFSGYYLYEKERLWQEERELLSRYASELEVALSKLHESNEDTLVYPRNTAFRSAIYDSDKKLIFSTIESLIDIQGADFFTKNKNTYLITPLSPHYLGAAFLVIQTESKPLGILRDILYIALFIIAVVIITSYFLVNIILRPLRENIKMLDNFIKDTTHELNTPITAILANIETIDADGCDPKTLKKLKRIDIASKSISNLYQDLAYLLLNHQTSTQNQELNLSEIARERVNYFLDMAQIKRLRFALEIQEGVRFFADKNKIERLLDNILSNAIKYAKRDTTIQLFLDEHSLIIEDEGKGMSKEELERVFVRYSRFDKSQGGFGIGYNIVKSIVDEYGISIAINSQIDIGTKVELRW